jgi:hypothetical protein
MNQWHEREPKWGQARFDSQRENAALTAVWRRIMRLITEAHLVDDEGSTERFQLATIDRTSTTDPLGTSLAEDKTLLASAQQYLVKGQCEGFASVHAQCEHCNARLGLKGWHRRQIRTVFGLINVQSARVRYWSTPTGASAGSRHQRGLASEGICHTASTAEAVSQTKQRCLLRTQGCLAPTLIRSPS